MLRNPPRLVLSRLHVLRSWLSPLAQRGGGCQVRLDWVSLVIKYLSDHHGQLLPVAMTPIENESGKVCVA
ncbi:hypothetical protein PI125_g1355 [Phytophthora idaei]|nr:hypothetical protein PI125_g1355 [Phytophthora idaei]